MTTSNTILLYLTMCGKGWLVIYMTWVLIISALTSLALHLMGTGFSICLVAMLKLPTPDKFFFYQQEERGSIQLGSEDLNFIFIENYLKKKNCVTK